MAATTTSISAPASPGALAPPTPLSRLGAACGIAYVVLMFVGNGIGGEADRVTAPGAFMTAKILELVGFAAFICFAAFLFEHLRRADRSWLPGAVVVVAAVDLAVKLSTAAAWLVHASLRAGELDAATVQLLDDIGAVGFALTFFTHGLLVLFISLSTLRSPFGTTWTARVGVVIGAASVATILLPLDSEVAALPFLLTMFWLVAYGVVTLRALARAGVQVGRAGDAAGWLPVGS